MIFYLKEDLTSYSKKKYAKKGDRIKIISDHDNCIVVELIDTKERFGINKSRISEEFIAKEKLIETKKPKK